MRDFLLNYKDIILRHNKSIVLSRTECDISLNIGNKRYSAPVLCSNMKSLITRDICKIFDKRKWLYVYHRIDGVEDVEKFVWDANNKENWRWEYNGDYEFNTISISVGVGEEWCDLVKRLKCENHRVDVFTVDVALSYNDNILPIISIIKEKFPDSYLIVGNGCTPEWIEWLENIGGIHCAKINVGVSSACKTRQYTGFGSTTVSSLIDCVTAAKNIDIMSDGGITVDSNGDVWIGDVNKSLVIGSQVVMSGALFSRCIDSPSIINGYYGNASEQAKQSKKHIEGTKIQVETNGLTISQMCDLIADSIKSGISYAGGNNLNAFKSVDWDIIK